MNHTEQIFSLKKNHNCSLYSYANCEIRLQVKEGRRLFLSQRNKQARILNFQIRDPWQNSYKNELIFDKGKDRNMSFITRTNKAILTFKQRCYAKNKNDEYLFNIKAVKNTGLGLDRKQLYPRGIGRSSARSKFI